MPTRATLAGVTLAASLVMAACSADQPVGEAAAPSGASSSSAPATTTAGAGGDAASTPRDATIPTGWVEVAAADTGPVVLERTGSGPTARVRYETAAEVAFALDFRSAARDTGDAPHLEMQGTATQATTGLWVSIDLVTNSDAGLDAASEPVGALISSSGQLVLYAPPDHGWAHDDLATIMELLRSVIIPLPVEPVAIEDTWTVERTDSTPALAATQFQVTDISGPLVTVALQGAHRGVLTIDTSSGRVMGTVHPNGAAPTASQSPWAPSLIIDSPVPAGSVAGPTVAVALTAGEERNGVVAGNFRVQYAGTSSGPTLGSSTPGFRGSASAVSGWSTTGEGNSSRNSSFGDQEEWTESAHQRAAAALFEGILPGWTLGTPLAGVDGTESTDYRIDGVGVSGVVVPIRWDIEETIGSTLVVAVDHDFEQDHIHRGYAFTVHGSVRGRFTVDRFNPWDIEGEVVADFDIRDDAGTTSAQQWWRAEPVDYPDRSDWTIREFDQLTPVVTLLSPGAGAEPAQERQYGGATWSGTIDIEQDWTRQWGFDDGGEFTLRADIDSRWDPVGQWIELRSIDATMNGVGTDRGDVRIENYAVIVAPDEVNRFAAEERTDEAIQLSALIYDLAALVTPPLPAEAITIGARWTVAPSNQTDLLLGTFTLLALDNGVATIGVEAPVDAYFGDRYDGWSIEADMTGTVEVDLAAAIPRRADLVADGTATFGVGGDRDPTTTEPWQQTITIRTAATTSS